MPPGQEGTSSRPAVVEPQSGTLLTFPLTEIDVVSDSPYVELMAVIPEEKKGALGVDVVLAGMEYSGLEVRARARQSARERARARQRARERHRARQSARQRSRERARDSEGERAREEAPASRCLFCRLGSSS